MSGISTHVLDLALGGPAAGVSVKLLRLIDGVWVEVAAQTTDADGRCRELLAIGDVLRSEYRLVFNTQAYFRASHSPRTLEMVGESPLYPEVVISFFVRESSLSYHMPLLLSPNGYTTYRGS